MEELMEIMLTHLDVINSLVVLQRELFTFEIVLLVFITMLKLINATGSKTYIVEVFLQESSSFFYF